MMLSGSLQGQMKSGHSTNGHSGEPFATTNAREVRDVEASRMTICRTLATPSSGCLRVHEGCHTVSQIKTSIPCDPAGIKKGVLLYGQC